jgi:hypothetical protein
MPRTSTASTDERRAAAQRARLARAARIARLRRRVLATALGTFALAFGVIAFDGSMGSATATSAPAPDPGPAAAASAPQQAQDELSAPADSGSGLSSDPLTTSQS